MQSKQDSHGVVATLTALAVPRVDQGHVAGWVDVGGPGYGPNGSAAWIQAGLAAYPFDKAARMYYEVVQPGRTPRYVQLDAKVAAGERHRIGVLELAKRPSWWRVWVDGRPVSKPVFLPGSHAGWPAQIVAESWNNGTGACNHYSYRFTNVNIAKATGGPWQRLSSTDVFEDPGYRVVRRTSDAFLATSLL
jgi:hypothetical protein